MRWSQLGFGRTSSTSRAQETPRNLMGFKDGTNNIKLEDGGALAEHVWVPASADPRWLRGGTYMVTRRIRMLIEVWDRASLDDQEQTIGRRKESGAPFGRKDEFDPVSLSRTPARRAHPPGGAERERRSPHPPPRLLVHRRMDVELGQLDAGLFFISYQNDPASFVELQRRLARVGRAQRVHQAHGQRALRLPAGNAAGRLRRRDAPRVAARPGARLTRWASPPSIRSSPPAPSPGPSPTRCPTTWAGSGRLGAVRPVARPRRGRLDRRAAAAGRRGGADRRGPRRAAACARRPGALARRVLRLDAGAGAGAGRAAQAGQARRAPRDARGAASASLRPRS